MPSLQAYSVRGKRYWRIVESYRDECGRPRLRVVRHLGTAQKLVELLAASPGRALWAEEPEVGATAALWDSAGRLRLVETIDRHAPKRRQGASVGQYMLLATINRAVDPKSKPERCIIRYCVFRGIVDRDSNRRWTPIPNEGAQGFRRDGGHFFRVFGMGVHDRLESVSTLSER